MNWYIKNKRQERALKALLSKECVPVKDIGPLIGALNPCQTIMELRRQGFNEAILTRRFTTHDRDGKRCCPGEYYIPDEHKPGVIETLVKYATSESGIHKATCKKNTPDSSKESNNDSI